MCFYTCALSSCLNEDLRYKHSDLLPLCNRTGNFSDPLPAFLTWGPSSEALNTDHSNFPRLLLNLRRQRRTSELHTTAASGHQGPVLCRAPVQKHCAKFLRVTALLLGPSTPTRKGLENPVRKSSKSRNSDKRRDECSPSLTFSN